MGKKGTYQLLFPNQAAGRNNLVKAHLVKAVPTGETSYFSMDDRPGMEKLPVVVSARSIDITKYFDVRTGKLKEGTADDGRKPRNHADHRLSSNLRARLTVGVSPRTLRVPPAYSAFSGVMSGWAAICLASKIAGHANTKITQEYTIVQLRRQEELTRRIQDKRAKAARRSLKTVKVA